MNIECYYFNNRSYTQVTTRDEFMEAINGKCMALAPWCDEEETEEAIRKWSASGDAMGAKTLNIPFN